MDETSAVAALASMAHSTRLRMLKALVVAGQTGLTAGAVADAVAATPSRASFHLSKLAETGLVSAKRQSREIVYTVSFQAMGDLIRFILEDCCGNNQQVRDCCDPSGRVGTDGI